MKCNRCGYINPNHIDTCLKCGNAMSNGNVQNQDSSQQNVSQSNPSNNFDMNNNQNNNQNNYQNNNLNTSTNNSGNFQQNNNFQPNVNYPTNSKNMAIAIILGFLVPGLGHAYDGLYQRAVVCFGVCLFLDILATFVADIFSIFRIIWWIYALYDVYVCTKAINQGSAIPKLVNYFELE